MNRIDVESVFDSIKALNEWKIYELKNSVKTENITCFLGAGLSVPFGIPLWDNLLKRMWVRLSDMNSTKMIIKANDLNNIDVIDNPYIQLLKQEYLKYPSEKYIAKLENSALQGKNMEQFDNLNLLEFAEYINNMLVARQNPLIKIEFYNKFLKKLIKDSLYYTYQDNNSKTAISILVEYLTKNTTKKKSIVTYNYDDILERQLFQKDQHILNKINIISRKSDIKELKEKKINIYHVHGFLPKSNKLKMYESESAVLTESSYEEIEQILYHWINTVQATAFLNSVNIFLGFSGQDHNFRRILKNIDGLNKRPLYNNFIFVSINSFIKKCRFIASADGGIESMFEKIQFINYLYSQEIYWGKYNIYPIWTTHDQLPNMLEEILIKD